jgi:hypothetical protein
MSQIVEEFVSEAAALMCAWYETGDVEEFDGDGARTVVAPAVVR